MSRMFILHKVIDNMERTNIKSVTFLSIKLNYNSVWTNIFLPLSKICFIVISNEKMCKDYLTDFCITNDTKKI